MNESVMQLVLMSWVMEEKHHEMVLPNTKSIYRWEADLISATKAWLTHEFEIKLTKADYRADANKRYKHEQLLRTFSSGRDTIWSPNYFWYVTWGFDLERNELPPYAGWAEVVYSKSWERHFVVVRVEAPRLHAGKMHEPDRLKVVRWLSYKLKNMYRMNFEDELLSA